MLTAVRLRYRINDGGERVGQGIDTVVMVCAADQEPTPETCEHDE